MSNEFSQNVGLARFEKVSVPLKRAFLLAKTRLQQANDGFSIQKLLNFR